MAKTEFDWGQFVDSQYYGLPKNSNWGKLPQWAGEAVPSNPAAWTGDLGTIRDNHRLRGYHGGVWQCQCREDFAGDWESHVRGKVAEFLGAEEKKV